MLNSIPLKFSLYFSFINNFQKPRKEINMEAQQSIKYSNDAKIEKHTEEAVDLTDFYDKAVSQAAKEAEVRLSKLIDKYERPFLFMVRA